MPLVAPLVTGNWVWKSHTRRDEMYKILRFYFNGRPRTVKRGLTLEEAQKHCKDPETSSRTATGSRERARTTRRGPWFEGYDHDEE